MPLPGSGLSSQRRSVEADGTRHLGAAEIPAPRDSGKGAVRLDLRWRSDAVTHCDSLCVPTSVISSDTTAPWLHAALERDAGPEPTTRLFAPGELVAGRDADAVVPLRPLELRPTLPGGLALELRHGRFYPSRVLQGSGQAQPFRSSVFRLVTDSANRPSADFNHPLAGVPLQLDMEVVTTSAADKPPGQGLHPIRSLLTDRGPGMQARWRGRPTAFFTDAVLQRSDDDDAAFYAQTRLVDHLDRTALAEISALYARLVPRRSRVLDLMSSWHSHLPSGLAPEAVVGLGMNADELALNPALTEAAVHDLNADPRLPFPEQAFDAVVCTASVEYLTSPFAVFREIARVLRPDGVAVMTFSNRWFPTKAVNVWQQLHEFERPALVLEYFRDSGAFADLNSWSLRGLRRPVDDAYARRLAQSDPVHAVWASRADSAPARTGAIPTPRRG